MDLERRRPVALLHDREAETLADWLRAHPSVTIIARDRLKAYRDGARAGAPQATQVADRFHLLQNLAEALDQVFSTHGNALKAVSDSAEPHPRRPARWPDRRPSSPEYADASGPDPGSGAPVAAARHL